MVHTFDRNVPVTLDTTSSPRRLDWNRANSLYELGSARNPQVYRTICEERGVHLGFFPLEVLEFHESLILDPMPFSAAETPSWKCRHSLPNYYCMGIYLPTW
jgi:hypothetical protein